MRPSPGLALVLVVGQGDRACALLHTQVCCGEGARPGSVFGTRSAAHPQDRAYDDTRSRANKKRLERVVDAYVAYWGAWSAFFLRI